MEAGKLSDGSGEFAPHTILWWGIQLPGHEICRLFSQGAEWHLQGTAVFSSKHVPCILNYRITCDAAWATQSAGVEGWLGSQPVNIQLRADSNHHWWQNGVEVPGVTGCLDIDLNFSPSTNLIPIRRLNLAIGEKAELTAAWLRFPGFQLEPLPQSYRRLEDRLYRYESGGGRFTADLQVNPVGFVTDYPGIWVAEVPGE